MSKQLTRRDFLKGTAAGAIGLAALGVAGIPAAKAEGTYKAGTIWRSLCSKPSRACVRRHCLFTREKSLLAVSK